MFPSRHVDSVHAHLVNSSRCPV